MLTITICLVYVSKWTWNCTWYLSYFIHDKWKTTNYFVAEISSHSNSNSVLDRLFLAKYLLQPFTADFSHLWVFQSINNLFFSSASSIAFVFKYNRSYFNLSSLTHTFQHKEFLWFLPRCCVSSILCKIWKEP